MRTLLLALLVCLTPPAFAGRRADREAAEAAEAALIQQLSADIIRLKASNVALASAFAEQQSAIRALEARQGLADAALVEAQLSLVKLEQQVHALEQVLSAPPSKKGKVDPQILELQRQVEALKAQIAAATVAAAAPSSAPRPPSSEADEQAASALVADANIARTAGDYARARALLYEVTSRYGETRAAKGASRLITEVELVGVRVPEPEVTWWFTKPAKLSDGRLTLLLFWEVWCPHCKREVPASAEWVEKYGGRGFQIIALTRLTKSSTREGVEQFIKENKLPFAVGQMTDATNELYKVSGIPAAALVKDGVIVWRGHPAKLTPELIEQNL